MGSYLIVFYLGYFFSILELGLKKLKLKVLFFSLYIIIFGFRNKIGVDWYNYQRFFKNFDGWYYLKQLDFSKFFLDYPNMDFGFKIINIFLIGNEEVKLLILQILISFLICISLNRFIEKDEVLRKYYFSYLIFFLIYYFFLDVDLLRQSIIFYSILYSYDLIFTKKKFIIFNGLIGICHITSSYINLLLLILLKKINLTKWKILILLIMYVIVKIFKVNLLLNKNFMYLFNFSNMNFIRKINKYLLMSNISEVNFSFFLNIGILICLIFFYKKIFRKNTKEEHILKVFLLMIVLETFFGNYKVAMNRFNYYYRFSIPYIVIYLINGIKIKKNIKKISVILITGGYLSLRLLLFYRDDNNKKVYLPYSNYILRNESINLQLIEKREKIENKTY